MKTCKIHNIPLIKRKDNRWYCKKCQAEAVQKRREKLKKLSIEYKGGKCQICGYNKCDSALEFHHIEPSNKDFGISEKGCTRSWDKVKEELDKCILVCSNCHREIHAGLLDIHKYIMNKEIKLNKE